MIDLSSKKTKMHRQNVYRKAVYNFNRVRKSPSLIIATLIILGSVIAVPIVSADSFQNQINSLNTQNAQAQSTVNSLQSQANSYQDNLNTLQAQITAIEAAISASETQQAQLQQQILSDQAQIAQQKQVLGSDISAIYVNGQMTTLEQLASSNNISDFVNAQTYRNAVQSKIQSTLDTISALEAQQQTQESQVSQLITGQKSQQSQLASAQSKEATLLSYNQQQQSSYNQQIASNNSQISALVAAQIAANSSTSTSGYYFLHFPGTITKDPINGSYAYAGWGFEMNTSPGCTGNPSDGPDQWGYCTRQCVSYAAWAVEYSGRLAPVDFGNAKDWVGAARRAGIQFDSIPQAGDVAITTAGAWGHAMYVEKVNGNQIFVSQYNQQLTGQFSTQWRTWE